MIDPIFKTGVGLTRRVKESMIQRALDRKLNRIESEVATPCSGASEVDPAFTSFARHPDYVRLQLMVDGGRKLGVDNPFFQELDAVSGATTMLEGRGVLNFSGYNYLGLAGHPAVNAASCAAIEQFGTSVSASRVVSGERSLHRDLEKSIADIYDADDAVAMVSGHATAVTTLGRLFGSRDLIIHDALIHNCALEGAKLSGAKRISFPHNDWEALDLILARCRHDFERVCIVIEGLYSMDGDFPELAEFIAVKRRRQAFLMVDEAHSLGVMGPKGFGLADHFEIDPREVDIWMGTLSKALASCGGYIAGEQALIDNLKHTAPGFVYSVGMSPPVAAAALSSLEILKAEPERVRSLQSAGQFFLAQARSLGVDTGRSTGFAIVPAVVGSSLRAVRLVNELRAQDINVQPILYPAVSEQSARLRFFLSAQHTEEQMTRALHALSGLLAQS
jgi:8-amino-7-oxononanoate synthase